MTTHNLAGALFNIDGDHYIYNDYAFDRSGNIWSNKSGEWRKLSRTSSGGYSLNADGQRHYLNERQVEALFKKSVSTVNATLDIVSSALDSAVEYFSDEVVAAVAEDLGAECEEECKFIIGTINGANMSISNTPVVHTSEISARQECERLAKANPGKRFVLLELKGICFVNNVAWG